MTGQDSGDPRTVAEGAAPAFVPLSAETACRKVELLDKCFPSQRDRDWWDDEVFIGLARLRGMECRARYAEAFRCTKSIVIPAAFASGHPQEGSLYEHRRRPGCIIR